MIRHQAADTIDGQRISAAYPNSTFAVSVNGANVSVNGTLLDLADGRVMFTPADGSVLYGASFVSSTRQPVTSIRCSGETRVWWRPSTWSASPACIAPRRRR